eukprot:jgi/Tetstr1/444130/TSEL_032028.t1
MTPRQGVVNSGSPTGLRQSPSQCTLRGAGLPKVSEASGAPSFPLLANFATLGATLALPLLAIPRADQDTAVRGLSSAAFNLLFPALLLVDTARVVSGAPSARALWLLGGCAGAQVLLGGLLGAGVAWAAGLATQPRRFRTAVVACAFGNATTLPLVLGSSLLATVPSLGDSYDAYVGYLALYQLAWGVALWTGGYAFLQGGQKPGDPSDEPADSPGVLARLASPPSLGSLAGAALGALGLGADPGPTSPAFPLHSALVLLGQGAQPALAAVLSLSLLGAPAPGDEPEAPNPPAGGLRAALDALDARLLGVTLVVRGLLLPAVGSTAVEWAWVQPWWGVDDPTAHLLFLLETAMPSAQVLVLLAQVGRQQGDGGGDDATSLARLLLAQYTLMMLPLSLWLGVFLQRALPAT